MRYEVTFTEQFRRCKVGILYLCKSFSRVVQFLRVVEVNPIKMKEFWEMVQTEIQQFSIQPGIVKR